MKSLMKDKKCIVIVNVASNCVFSNKTYKLLQSLYEEYKSQGLEILAFPCNQFLHSEPESDEKVAEFVKEKFGATFPIFKKIMVNGEHTHPIFRHLKESRPFCSSRQRKQKNIPWNFSKFILDGSGRVRTYLSPEESLETVKSKILERLI